MSNIRIPNCMSCCACCSSYDNKWIEVDENDAAFIPANLLQSGAAQPFAMIMCNGRCVALSGTIANNVKCLIYADRPTICRKVMPGSDLCLYSLGLCRIPIY